MTLPKAEQIVHDYDSGRGLTLKEIAYKHQISYATARSILVRMGAYIPQRNLYEATARTQEDAVWKLAHAERLLDKVIRRHEGGLLPCRILYDQIKDYFKTKKENND